VLGHNLEVKGQECERYEVVAMETASIMEQSAGRIQDLEETVDHLQKHVSWLGKIILNL